MSELRIDLAFQALDRVTAPLRKMLEGTRKLENGFIDLRNELDGFKKLNKQIEDFKKLKRGLLENRDAAQQNTAKLAALAQEMSAVEKPSRELKRAWKEATREATKLKNEKVRLLQASHQIRGALVQAGFSTKNLGDHQAKLKKKINDTSQALEKQKKQLLALQKVKVNAAQLREKGESISSFGMDLAPMAGAAGLAAAMPVRSFLKTESEMRKLESTMTKANGKRSELFDDMVKNAEALSKILPGTTAEMLNITNIMMKKGMSEKTVLGGGAKGAAQLGVLMNGDFEGAVDVLSVGTDALGLQEKDMLMLADYMQKLAHFGMNSGQMTELLKSYAPNVKMSGLKGEALVKHLSKFGVMAAKMEMEAGSFGNALGDLTSSTLDSDKVSKANKLLAKHKIKLNFMDDKGNYKGDDHFMQEMLKLKGLSDKEFVEVKKALFGNDKQKNEVLAGILRFAEDWQNISKELDNQGSMQQRLAVSMQSLQNKWGTFTATLDNAMFKIGAGFEDEMKGVLDAAAKLAEKFTNFIEQNPKLAKGLFMVVAGFAAIAAAVMGLALFLGAALAPFAALKFVLGTMAIKLLGFGTVASKVGSVIATAFNVVRVAMLAALANPALLAGIAIVAALAAAAYLIYNNWDTIKTFFTDLWNNIKQGAADLLSFLTGLASNFAKVGLDMMSGLANGILNGLGLAKEATASAAGGVEGAARTKLDTHSPSRVFAAIGGDTMAGLALGIAQGSGQALASMGDSMMGLTAAADVPFAAPMFGAVGAFSGGQNAASQQNNMAQSIVIHVHPSEGMDEQKLAEKIKQIVQSQNMGGSKNSALYDLE